MKELLLCSSGVKYTRLSAELADLQDYSGFILDHYVPHA